MKKTKAQNRQTMKIEDRINEIDDEIKRLLSEKKRLSGVVEVPNRLFTNCFDLSTDGGYDYKFNSINWESPKEVLNALAVVESSCKELRDLIKESKKITWYGEYYKDEE